jgi:hypothetical protein
MMQIFQGIEISLELIGFMGKSFAQTIVGKYQMDANLMQIIFKSV